MLCFMYICRISIYSIQHDSDIVYNCFNNLPQSPGKILYAKFLRTDPYPISPHQLGSGQEMSWCTNISGGEFFTSFGQRTFIYYIPPYLKKKKRHARYCIGGPHGGVANPLHFVKQSFLESDKKNTGTLQISTSPSSLGFDQIPCPTKAFGSPQLTRLPLWDEVNFRIIDVQSTLFLHVEFDRLNFVDGQTLLVTFLGYQILP